MPIRVWGDPVLRKRAKPADPDDPELRQLVDTMLATMRKAEGLGLAAPQIGSDLRVAVIDGRAMESGDDLVMLNPIIEVAWGDATLEEGCLSLPGLWVDVKRATHLKLRYTDTSGCEQVLRASDMLAIAVQHEVDHLDGVLLVDRVSPAARRMISGQLERIKEAGRADE